MPTPDEVRATLVALADARSDSLSSLSRLIGRNAAYLRQFVTRGTPDRLDEADRLVLTKHFRVDERRLRACEPRVSPKEFGNGEYRLFC